MTTITLNLWMAFWPWTNDLPHLHIHIYILCYAAKCTGTCSQGATSDNTPIAHSCAPTRPPLPPPLPQPHHPGQWQWVSSWSSCVKMWTIASRKYLVQTHEEIFLGSIGAEKVSVPQLVCTLEWALLVPKDVEMTVWQGVARDWSWSCLC